MNNGLDWIQIMIFDETADKPQDVSSDPFSSRPHFTALGKEAVQAVRLTRVVWGSRPGR